MKNIFIWKTAKWISLCCFFLGSNVLFAQIIQDNNPIIKGLEDSVLVTIEVYDSYTGYPIQAYGKRRTLSFQCNELGRVSVYCRNRESVDFTADGFYNRGFYFGEEEMATKNKVFRLDMYPISKQMEALTVIGYSNKRSNLSTPASVGIAKIGQHYGDGSSLQNAFNSLSGVSYDSRGYGGSTRLNIRGSFYRAPTTIRNVKMYWKGIAMTSADGQTPLEIVDPSNVANANILKGPGSGIWGNGTGGIILFTPFSLDRSVYAKAQYEHGEFGYNKTVYQAGVSKNGFSLMVSQVNQGTNGYRDQEANKKEQTLIEFSASTKRWKHYVMALRYKGYWELPGAISAAQIAVNPRQANAFSMANNAHVDRSRDMVGYSGEFLSKKNFLLELSANLFQTEKINPYGTSAASSGYKDESAVGKGQRAVLSKAFDLNKNGNFPIKLKSSIGEEVQFETFHLNEFGLLNGESNGVSKYNFNVDYITSNYFNQVEAEVAKRLFATASVGLNNTQARITGTSRDAAQQLVVIEAYTNANPQARLYPNVGISYSLSRNEKSGDWNVFGNYSTGSSAPTVFEQYDYSNQLLNTQLKNEFARNVEFGVKGAGKLWFVEMSLYDQQITDAIVPKAALFNGYYATYINAGKLVQQGMEVMARRKWDFERSTLAAWTSGSWTNYQLEGESGTGRMPGMPMAQCNWGVNFKIDKGFGIGATNQWTDKAPLNSAQTDWSAARNVLNSELTYGHTFVKRDEVAGDYDLVQRIRYIGDVNIIVGANNVLNTTYTTFYQLNGVGGKFFNPMARRNFYSGITLRIFL
ncbi:MAG: TonB-dependent receptor [Sediminibacterium sp.]